MKKFTAALVMTGAIALASSAHAVTVDGLLSAGEYAGGSLTHVGYDPLGPNSNFGAPTSTSDTTAYDIYLRASGGDVYGYLQAANGPVIGAFANLYWDIDPANGNGSDIGFELSAGHQNFFIPGGPPQGVPIAVSGITVAQSADGLGIEFSIPNSFFASYVPGVAYYDNQQLPGVGDDVVLRLSQSFSYSVAGGPDFGADRLGRVTLSSAAPEPAAWSLMILGFLGAGAALRSRRGQGSLA